MKKSELDEIIREIVQNEIKVSMKRYVQAYVPIVVNEVVSDLIDKRLNETRGNVKQSPAKKGASSGLSLNEIAEMAEEEMTSYDIESKKEWASLTPRPITSGKAQHWDKQKLASMLGYDSSPVATGTNTIDMIISDKGTPIPVNPAAIPEDLSEAFNKNYSEMLAKMNARTS
jgi:hypothetical protein